MKRLCAFLAFLLIPSLALAEGDVWVLVDTEARVLTLMLGDRIEQRFEDIAIGRYGVTRTKRRMDNMTPLGEFWITRISRDSRFRVFLGISYPNMVHAEHAMAQGWLSEKDWRSIVRAERQHAVPPQDTPMGGYLGIHGLGDGDPEIHAEFNWTNGCIALTNEQVEALVERVGVGTRVVIR